MPVATGTPRAGFGTAATAATQAKRDTMESILIDGSDLCWNNDNGSG